MATIYDIDELQKENEQLRHENNTLKLTLFSVLKELRKLVSVDSLPEFDETLDRLEKEAFKNDKQ